MTDYIERDAFWKELINTPFHPRCKTTPDLLTSVQDRLNDTLEMLKNFPAADVRPVVRGEWHDFEYGKCLCSECGQVYSKELAAVVNYCAKCGAEMEVEHETD